MIDPHAHPAIVPCQVVHPLGDAKAQFLVTEIMGAHSFWATLWSPFPPGLLEIPEKFLLFGVHRDYGLATTLELLDLAIDVLELGIAIRMLLALAGLAVALEAVVHVFQQTRHSIVADGMTQSYQGVCQVARTLARP